MVNWHAVKVVVVESDELPPATVRTDALTVTEEEEEDLAVTVSSRSEPAL